VPFLMGTDEAGMDEFPVHRVELTDPFYIGKFPVTQQEYLQIMGSNPSVFAKQDKPVEHVTWGEACEYCRKLTLRERKADRIPATSVFRLPSEAEWEYCCRAVLPASNGNGGPGKNVVEITVPPPTDFHFGNDPEKLAEYAWFEANSGKRPHPVGQKKPNAFNLFDMHGNVGEWCADWLGPYTAEVARNPVGPAQGTRRVRRGGCWASIVRNCRCARRIGVLPDCRSPLLGFRVVLAAETNHQPVIAVNPNGPG